MKGLLTAEEVAGVRKPLEHAHWLPARAYRDREVSRAEVQRIFLREWMCVGLVDQVRRPGDYLAAATLSQRILVVHGDDGQIRAFYNVCRHRGMWLAEGSGNTDCFTCPYHGWRYDLQGQLVAAREMHKTEGFDVSKVRLKSLRTEVWQGFILINFDDAAEPLGPRIQDLNQIVAPWNIIDLKVVAERRFDIEDWNWKIMMENGVEGYHVTPVHADSAQGWIPVERSYTSEVDGRHWSDLHHPFSDRELERLAAGGPDVPPAIPGLPVSAQREIAFYFVWPAVSFYLGREGMVSFLGDQDEAGRTQFIWRFHAPEAMREWSGFERYCERAAQWAEEIQIEDERVCRGAFQGVLSAAWEPPRYSHMEKPIRHFHRWYAERMAESYPASTLEPDQAP